MNPTDRSEGRSVGATWPCLTASSVGLVIFGLQPLILGGLVTESRLTAAAVGLAVTIECLTMAAGSLIGLGALKRLSGPAVTAIGGLSLAIFSLLSMQAPAQVSLLFLRGLSGLAEGFLAAPALALIAHSARPERMAAAFLGIQTVMQASLSFGLPLQHAFRSIANAGLCTLALLGFAAAMLAIAVPPRLADGHSQHPLSIPAPAPLLILASAALYVGALVCGWGFFGVYLTSLGYSEATQGAMFALSLAAQFIGVNCAAYLAGRSDNRLMIVLSGVILACLLGLFLSFGAMPIAAWVSIACYGFLWTFMQPFATGHLIALDPSRRSVLLLSPYQLTGAALLPLCGSVVVKTAGVGGTLMLSAVFALCSAICAYSSAYGNRARG